MPDDRLNGYTVARLGATASMVADRWAITKDGETVATVDYKTARLYWLGRLKLVDLLDLVGGGHD